MIKKLNKKYLAWFYGFAERKYFIIIVYLIGCFDCTKVYLGLHNMKILYFDLDNVICTTKGNRYPESKLKKKL